MSNRPFANVRSMILFIGLIMFSVSQIGFSDTVLKFDFGNTSSFGDVELVSSELLSVDDGDMSTPGAQTTSTSFNGFLDPFFADISSGSSLTISGIIMDKNAIDSSGAISETTTGGTFSLFDDSNDLLLSGNIGDGFINGGTNSSTATFFTIGPTLTFTGGSLLPFFDPDSGSLTVTLNSVKTGASTGLIISGNTIADFSADATGQIEAVAVPEPGIFALSLAGTLILALRRRRHQH